MFLNCRFFLFLRLSSLVLCASLAQTVRAADWPQMLGPTRNNIAAEDEKPLPKRWPSEGPPIIWQKVLGTGFAGPAVVGEKLIIFHREKDEAVVEALNKADATQLWRFSYPTSYKDSFGFDNGPRATPTVSGGKVFVHGAEGMLHALDLATGKVLWKVDTVKEFGSPQGFFGRACAPLVVGDTVILTPGGDRDKVVTAFDVKDGKVKWSVGEDGASYSSPVLASENVVLCWLRNHLTTISLKDGTILGRELFRPSIEASVSAAIPIKTDHGWFISAAYGVGASFWDVGADGKLNKTWNAQEVLDSHYSTAVYYKGHVYGFDGRQESGQSLVCLDTETHKAAWIGPPTKGGIVLLVKDTLLGLHEDGSLVMVKANPVEMEPLSEAQILRAGHRSYPAYSNGVIYARDGVKMVAVRLAP